MIIDHTIMLIYLDYCIPEAYTLECRGSSIQFSFYLKNLSPLLIKSLKGNLLTIINTSIFQ